LEEAAKMWKKESTVVIVDGDSDTLKSILKGLESCMVGGKVQTGKAGLSRQGSFAFSDPNAPTDVQSGRPNLDTHNSFGLSSLDVEENEEDEENKLKDPREWIKVVNAFDQPRLAYNVQKKNFDK
jgi:DNA polymerase epsilon subunit 2